MSGPGGQIDRRSFFKVIATSGAVAAASGCSRPASELLSLVTPPEEIIPGVATYFATTCRECPSGCGVLAKNRDGRIIKLEGNPSFPGTGGALCIAGQAALQGLYHPDRYRGALSAGKPLAWNEAEKQVADKVGALVKAGQGRKIALVSGLESGSLGRLMDDWVRVFGARPRVAYEAIGYESLRAANRAVFGRDASPQTQAIADTYGYTVAFGVSAGLLVIGVILAIILVPSRRELADVGDAAVATRAAPGPAPELAAPTTTPAQQQVSEAIPVALCSCSPLLRPVARSSRNGGIHPPESPLVHDQGQTHDRTF